MLCASCATLLAREAAKCDARMLPEKRAICDAAHYRRYIKDSSRRQTEEKLIQAADKNFADGEFLRAFEYYGSARVILPTAYAYLMEGRAWFVAGAARPRLPESGAQACYAAAEFALMVENDVPQYYRAGLALAEQSANCLDELALKTKASPAVCVDISALRACMGVR